MKRKVNNEADRDADANHAGREKTAHFQCTAVFSELYEDRAQAYEEFNELVKACREYRAYLPEIRASYVHPTKSTRNSFGYLRMGT